MRYWQKLDGTDVALSTDDLNLAVWAEVDVDTYEAARDALLAAAMATADADAAAIVAAQDALEAAQLSAFHKLVALAFTDAEASWIVWQGARTATSP